MTQTRRRNQSSDNSPVLTYAILAIFGVAAFFFFSGNDKENSQDNSPANRGIITVQALSGAEGYLYTKDWEKTLIEENVTFGNTEKIRVEKWDVKVSQDGNILFFDKNTEASFGTAGLTNLRFDNGQIWADYQNTSGKIEMRNFKVSTETGSTFLIEQNQISSRIYILAGRATIDVAGKTIELFPGKKFSILNSEKNLATLNPNEKIEEFDDIVKQNEFFVRQWGLALLEQIISNSGSNNLLSGSTNTGNLMASGDIISIKDDVHVQISYPEDESTVTETNFSIEGKVSGSKVAKVTINDKQASINKDEGTFTYKDFKVTNEITNIVYKAFDTEWILLQKGAITIYAKKEKLEATVEKPTVTAYPINDKNFRIIAPTENPYKTTEDVVKIQGTVNAGAVKYITINNYRLTSFKAWGTAWHYFANKDFGTLKDDSINTYEIKYFWMNGELLLKQQFTIIKEKKNRGTSSEVIINN